MIERIAQRAVEAAVADTPAVLVHGPRQAGKSTLMREVAQRDGRRQVTLDDPLALALARESPQEFLHVYEPPIAIDEIQRAPELFLPIKAWIDRNRRPGSFLLTGSANVLLLPKMADSLAGRMEVVDLGPFSQAEVEGSSVNPVDFLFTETFRPAIEGDPDSIGRRLLAGGFPEATSRTGARRSAWFQAYLRTILERDVRDLANIDGLTQMPRLLALLATRSGTTLNIASLSRDTGIAHTTLTRYLDLLEATFLLQLVPAWSIDGAKLTRTPKTYLVDSGLLCYLARVEDRALADRDRLAPILENFVANELTKAISVSETRPFLAHLRTVRQKEVDFVLDAGVQGLIGIEVRPTRSVQLADADGLRYLAEVAGERFRRGILLYLGTESVPLGKDLWALPVDALWRSPG